MFQTQQSLVDVAGHAVWLPYFIPTKSDHLHFVNRLLKIFCELDICCTLTGTYPAYIAGALMSFNRTKPAIGAFCIARTTSIILDNIFRKAYSFEIGEYQFHLTDWRENDNMPDESTYAITLEDVTLNFSFNIVDVSVSCGS